MQLHAVVTLVLAVVILGEPCTMLQVGGAILMVSGSLVTQRASQPAAPSKAHETSAFTPRVAAGFFFALIAALAYGTSPIIVRQALLDAGPLGGLAGGSVAYAAATVAVTLGLLVPQRHDSHPRERSLVRLLGHLRCRGP
jgi:drug/metabolite transporter (DMT)-like permease